MRPVAGRTAAAPGETPWNARLSTAAAMIPWNAAQAPRPDAQLTGRRSRVVAMGAR